MIIDCHGHYTTAPGALQAFRDAQIARFEDAAKSAPGPIEISDDEIRESIEANQLGAMRPRAASCPEDGKSDPGYDELRVHHTSISGWRQLAA